VPAAGPLGQGQTIDVAVAGVDGIPADAVSVAVNVTIDEDATFESFLTVWPAGEARPNGSANNAEPGLVSPNSGLYKLGVGGKLSVFNQQGAVHVIIDVTGYFVAATTGTGGQGPATSAGNWGVENRNTIGSPVVQLRSGPVTPPGTGAIGRLSPPSGLGSLNLSAATNEQVVYGNEVDFFRRPFDVTAVGFSVYNNLENINAGPGNMPSIKFEVDPNRAESTSNFSTLNFVPDVTPPGVWTDIDATTTGLWFGTGAAFAGTVCDPNGSLCTWDQLQELINPAGDLEGPVLLSVGVGYGRFLEWHGAIDALRVGDTVYDFEEYGVTPTAAPAP
jgi:hypothetical protein